MGRTAGLLLKAPSYTSDAIFSPNMRWIAYGSRQSGAQGIYATPYPGPIQHIFLPDFAAGLNSALVIGR